MTHERETEEEGGAVKVLVQLLTRNDCYRAGRTITPKGVMLHSTGANNPDLCRYVPGDDVIGRNTGGNHWDMPGVGACVHAFVGKLADGSVGAVQTLPWNWRGWHCGSGSKGSANNTHISFEICEDGLTDKAYFQQVYQGAVELTAQLCRTYGLNPTQDGVVICHCEGHERGLASNHGDVMHWFPRFGKSMDTFRADVARAMEGGEDLTEEQVRTIVRDEVAKLQAQQAAQPVSDWAKELLAEAVAQGITDGKRPQAPATRQEVALMVQAGLKSKQ